MFDLKLRFGFILAASFAPFTVFYFVNPFPGKTFVVLLLAWIFAFAAIWIATDHLILRHLTKIGQAASDLAEGNLDVRVEELVNPPHSIERLRDQIDSMADNLSDRERFLERTLAEKETMLREIHHRVRNNLQIVTSILNMQERKYKSNEEIQVVQDVRDRINAISAVHASMYNSDSLVDVDVADFTNRVVDYLSPSIERNLELEVEAFSLALDQAVPLALFIVVAAPQVGASDERSNVSIRIYSEESICHLIICDSDDVFPTEAATPDSDDMKLLTGLARQLGGDILMEDGRAIRLEFPIRTD